MPEGERISERQLRELLDKEEIRDLALHYCHHVRAREIDKIVDQYAADAAFELPEGLEEGLSGPHGGREAIRASLVAGLPSMNHGLSSTITSSTLSRRSGPWAGFMLRFAWGVATSKRA